MYVMYLLFIYCMYCMYLLYTVKKICEQIYLYKLNINIYIFLLGICIYYFFFAILTRKSEQILPQHFCLHFTQNDYCKIFIYFT